LSGAFKQEMLEKVGNSAFGIEALVAGADANVNGDRGAVGVTHRCGNDLEAVGETSALNVHPRTSRQRCQKKPARATMTTASNRYEKGLSTRSAACRCVANAKPSAMRAADQIITPVTALAAKLRPDCSAIPAA